MVDTHTCASRPQNYCGLLFVWWIGRGKGVDITAGQENPRSDFLGQVHLNFDLGQVKIEVCWTQWTSEINISGPVSLSECVHVGK